MKKGKRVRSRSWVLKKPTSETSHSTKEEKWGDRRGDMELSAGRPERGFGTKK